MTEAEIEAAFGQIRKLAADHGVWRLSGSTWDHADRLQSHIAALRAASTWQSIESAPKDGTEVLIYEFRDGQHIRQVAKYVQSFKMKEGVWAPAEWHWVEVHGEGYETYEPTHWTPLLASPAHDPSTATHGEEE